MGESVGAARSVSTSAVVDLLVILFLSRSEMTPGGLEAHTKSEDRVLCDVRL